MQSPMPHPTSALPLLKKGSTGNQTPPMAWFVPAQVSTDGRGGGELRRIEEAQDMENDLVRQLGQVQAHRPGGLCGVARPQQQRWRQRRCSKLAHRKAHENGSSSGSERERREGGGEEGEQVGGLGGVLADGGGAGVGGAGAPVGWRGPGGAAQQQRLLAGRARSGVVQMCQRAGVSKGAADSRASQLQPS